MSACTVTTSATGTRCGAPAVTVREGIFGGELAECSEHAAPAPASAPAAPAEVKVEVSWHSWPKPGVIVAERPKTVDVRFIPRAGAEPIVRRFPRADVRFA
jgi:hypothetical protein